MSELTLIRAESPHVTRPFDVDANYLTALAAADDPQVVAVLVFARHAGLKPQEMLDVSTDDWCKETGELLLRSVGGDRRVPMRNDVELVFRDCPANRPGLVLWSLGKRMSAGHIYETPAASGVRRYEARRYVTRNREAGYKSFASRSEAQAWLAQEDARGQDAPWPREGTWDLIGKRVASHLGSVGLDMTLLKSLRDRYNEEMFAAFRRIFAGQPQTPFEQALRAAEDLLPDTRVRDALVLARYAGLWPYEMAALRPSDLADGILSVTGRHGPSSVPAVAPVIAVMQRPPGPLFASLRYSALGGRAADTAQSERDHMTNESISELVMPHLHQHAPGLTMRELRNQFNAERAPERVVRDVYPSRVGAVSTLYLQEMKALGAVSTSLRTRRQQIASWERHLYPRGLESATRVDMTEFLGNFDNPGTKLSIMSAVNSLHSWGRATDRLTNDPVAGLRKPKRPRSVPRPIPDPLFHQALQAADPRLAAMLILARFAGLRCCEIARVHTRDLVGEHIYVVGKGGHRDAVPAHPEVAGLLSRPIDGWLFPSGHRDAPGPHLTASSVSTIGNRHLRQHAPGWTMHKLRHAFATELIRSTHDLLITQKAMRHASPTTTAGYAQLDDEDIVSAVRSLTATRIPR